MKSKNEVRKRLQGIIDELCSSEDGRVPCDWSNDLNFDGKKDDSQGSDLGSNICVNVKSGRKIIWKE